ncbi:hypothetical protein IL306_006491, partial [Fusarium sp. DS 682]
LQRQVEQILWRYSPSQPDQRDDASVPEEQGSNERHRRTKHQSLENDAILLSALALLDSTPDPVDDALHALEALAPKARDEVASTRDRRRR